MVTRWMPKMRTIRGVRRRVKVHKTSTGERVRVLKKRNYKDSTAPKKNRKRRVKNFVNHPDSGRKDFKRS